MKVSTLPSLEILLHQLDNVQNVDVLRLAIVAHVHKRLHEQDGRLDDWETTHLANAIGALELNVNAVQQPTIAWLRLCLVDLQRALMPEADRHETVVLRSDDGVRITREQLIEAVDAIAQNLDVTSHA